MKIFGVEILNAGAGNSIDDAVNEQQATFVARSVEPWVAPANQFTGNHRRNLSFADRSSRHLLALAPTFSWTRGTTIP
jgi:hypothetical protein